MNPKKINIAPLVAATGLIQASSRGYLSIRLLLAIWLLCSLGSMVATEPLAAQSNSNDDTVPGVVRLYLPIIARQQAAGTIPAPTPTPIVERIFDAIPIASAPSDRPAVAHPDLNLALRSYVATNGELALVDNNGPTDQDAPQLAGIFQPARLSTFVALHRVHDWDWSCAPDGCQGGPISTPPVTLLELGTTPGEALHIPTRSPEIYGGGYKAMVLYAEANRITLSYTRDDTAAVGYIVHMEDVVVDPALLALYQANDSAGRGMLPALRNHEPFATAAGSSIKIAIRDTGTFMEPRSRKDWWHGY